MKYEYRGRNIEINEQVKTLTEKKLNRTLSKFFTDDALVRITFRVETKKEAAAEITIPLQGTAPIRAEARNADKMLALDEAIEKIEKQLIRHRKKLNPRIKTDSSLRRELNLSAETADALPDEEMVIRRVKEIVPQTMDVSEACLQMELLDHDFFIFRDQETDQISVVYKRKEAGTYGMIITR